MTNLTDLEADALRVMRDLAATNSIRDHADRRAARDAVKPLLTCNGVSVRAMIPNRVSVYRRDHVRFEYNIDGRRASKALAQVRLAGGEG